MISVSVVNVDVVFHILPCVPRLSLCLGTKFLVDVVFCGLDDVH